MDAFCNQDQTTRRYDTYGLSIKLSCPCDSILIFDCAEATRELAKDMELIRDIADDKNVDSASALSQIRAITSRRLIE